MSVHEYSTIFWLHFPEVRLFNLFSGIVNRVKWDKAKWILANKMMHLRLHVRHIVPRNSFSVAYDRIAVGESIVTGDLLSLEVASEPSSRITKNETLPAISGYWKREVVASSPSEICVYYKIELHGKGSREHNFRNAFAIRVPSICISFILVIYWMKVPVINIQCCESTNKIHAICKIAIISEICSFFPSFGWANFLTYLQEDYSSIMTIWLCVFFCDVCYMVLPSMWMLYMVFIYLSENVYRSFLIINSVFYFITEALIFFSIIISPYSRNCFLSAHLQLTWQNLLRNCQSFSFMCHTFVSRGVSMVLSKRVIVDNAYYMSCWTPDFVSAFCCDFSCATFRVGRQPVAVMNNRCTVICLAISIGKFPAIICNIEESQ